MNSIDANSVTSQPLNISISETNLVGEMEHNEEHIKSEIKKVIDDFRENYKFHKEHSEANTETRLVEPLFKALGWNEKDWTKQEQIHRGQKQGRADYIFKINERIVFVLEVKKVGIPLEKEANIQVISYALSKRIPFAISTNFERLNIFCVEQEDALNNKFRVFTEPENYLTNLNDLLFLSKQSFEENLILKKAESEGRLKRRVSIDKTLLDDLMNVRKLIANDIEKNYSEKYASNEKDEIVQRIIDRLIFIRRCEDTGINPDNIMLEELNRLPDNRVYGRLKDIFQKYDDVYNSGLFAIAKDNDCDIIKIDGTIIKKLLSHLYQSKDGTYIYDFDWIDADVLGQVYEQYLGIILAQTKSGKSKLKEGQAHRKEQGIYYTPTYIVDYIVKNTVGELIKERKDMKNIKILDPACGSGSFLIKAFDYMNDALTNTDSVKQHRLDSQGAYSIKTEILKNNIYGVDLDNKAVEITKLNLLLKAAEKNRKLPDELDKHVRHGNSLIDDSSIAGLDAFKWTDEFEEGSFDVVIGNPPYIRNTELSKTDKSFFNQNYVGAHKQYDILVLFFERGIKLLKNEGYLGFITSNKFMASDYGEKLRELILKNCKIISLIDVSNLKIFKDASTYPVIAIFQKINNKTQRDNNIISFHKIEDLNKLSSNKQIIKIKQSKFSEEKDNKLIENKGGTRNEITKNIEQGSKKLKELFLCQRGSPKNKIKIIEKRTENSVPCIMSRDVGRYSIKISKNNFITSNLQKKIFNSEKILMPRTVLSLKASLDEGCNFIMDRIYFLIPKENVKVNLKLVTGILNSKLIDFYYKLNFGSTHVGGGYLDLRGTQIVEIPIKITTELQQKPLIKLVDKMLSLNKQLNSFNGKKTAETAKLEEEIKATDYEIDQLVYELYSITKEEQKIIEESLK